LNHIAKRYVENSIFSEKQLALKRGEGSCRRSIKLERYRRRRLVLCTCVSGAIISEAKVEAGVEEFLTYFCIERFC